MPKLPFPSAAVTTATLVGQFSAGVLCFGILTEKMKMSNSGICPAFLEKYPESEKALVLLNNWG